MINMKLREQFLFFLLILYSGISRSQTVQLPDLSSMDRKPLLEESFDSNSKGWITDNQYISGTLGNGVYKIRCKNYQGTSGLTTVAVEIDRTKDLEIETSLKVISGTGGIAFWMNNNYFHYRIEFNNNGDIFVVKQSTRLETLYKINKNPAIKSGSKNKFLISKVNNVFYLFINDTFIKEFTGIKPEGSNIGFNVGLNSEIEADYLKVSYLSKKETPLVAERNVTNNESVKAVKADEKPDIQAAVITSLLPSGSPVINWTSPSSERVNVAEYTVHAKASVKSQSRLSKVLFYVNGVATGESEFQSLNIDSGRYSIDKIINLKPGENSVYFLATNDNGESTRSPMRYFVNPESTPPVLGWVYPTEVTSTVNTENINIEGLIKSPSGINSAIILVNGVPQVEENTLQPTAGSDMNYHHSIILREGENSVYIIAANNAGRTQSEKRTIIYNKTLAEKRLALVIGNSEYKNGTSLKNPVNDANLVEGTLKELGFDVLKCLNVGIDSMKKSIREFSRRMSSYNVALFYYAGHGLQVDGVNYLIPTDAKLENKDDCNWEAVAVETVTDEFRKHTTNTNIVILDACRNNPYKSWVRGPEQGFKAMGPINGTIISYATSEGATAADGTAANGLYTEELVKQMIIPQQIENVFKATRRHVMERSKNQQVPVEWNYLIGDFYFKK
jgi:hypothetical protein